MGARRRETRRADPPQDGQDGRRVHRGRRAVTRVAAHAHRVRRPQGQGLRPQRLGERGNLRGLARRPGLRDDVGRGQAYRQRQGLRLLRGGRRCGVRDRGAGDRHDRRRGGRRGGRRPGPIRDGMAHEGSRRLGQFRVSRERARLRGVRRRRRTGVPHRH